MMMMMMIHIPVLSLFMVSPKPVESLLYLDYTCCDKNMLSELLITLIRYYIVNGKLIHDKCMAVR
jgi:hypothetical protein